MTNKVSLVIITKNRPTDLAHCYSFLKKLVVFPDEFILVDSSNNSKSRLLTKRLAAHVPFSVRYIQEPRLGFPVSRNRGLKAATHPWVAFTDDDCVIDPLWIRSLKHSITSHPRAAAIAGESSSLYPHNPISQAASFNEWIWKKKARNRNKILDLETLDNKNVVYSKAFLKKNGIKYDDKRAKEYFGACDDCDLGMQIQKAGGAAYYEPRAIVYHKDLASLVSFTRRYIERSFAYIDYENKWRSFRNTLQLRPLHKGFMPLFKHYIKINNLNVSGSIMLFVLHAYSYTIKKAVYLYHAIKKY